MLVGNGADRRPHFQRGGLLQFRDSGGISRIHRAGVFAEEETRQAGSPSNQRTTIESTQGATRDTESGRTAEARIGSGPDAQNR